MTKYIKINYKDLNLIKSTTIKFINLAFSGNNTYNLAISKDKNCRMFLVNKNAISYNFSFKRGGR